MNNLTIGILLTDHVLDDLKPKHGDQDNFYSKIFGEVDTNIKLRIYDVTLNDYPADMDECDGYLITGSKLSVYDDVKWIRDLEHYIRSLNEHKKFLLGVCFGHQLIAKALGGEVRKAEIGWVTGLQSYIFHDNFPWLRNLNQDIKLIHSHQDQITKLPDQATLVASNENVPIAMYFIDNHIMSIQGHPEFTNEYAYDVVCKRRDIIGEELFKRTEESLLNETSSYLEVTNWWIEFFKYQFKTQ
jgi:GMP synthase-like glutamine amidotransferase